MVDVKCNPYSVSRQPAELSKLSDRPVDLRPIFANWYHISFNRPTFKKGLNALMSTNGRQTLHTVCRRIENFLMDYSTTVSAQKIITWLDRHKIGRPTKKEVEICQDNSWRTADCCPNNSKTWKKATKTFIYYLLAIKQHQ